MGKFWPNFVIIFICISHLSLFGQVDDLIIESNSGGLVNYTTTSTDPGTLFFTLFGDGYYSTIENPKHKFVQDNDGFTTTTYFVKPYKPNNPPKLSVSTGATGTGASYINPVPMFDEKTKIFTSWSPSFRTTNFYILAFQNNFSQTAIDGCVEFHYFSRKTRPIANQILEYNNWVFNRIRNGSPYQGLNRSFNWEFEDLAFGEVRYVYIPTLTTVEAPEPIIFNTVMRPGCSDQVFEESSEFEVALFPHDPNVKRPEPPCFDLSQSAHEVTYTISFFNDGETYATDVLIKDALSSQFDLSTFTFIDSEYPANVSLNGNVLNVELPGIKLPGTNQEIPHAFSLEECTSWIKFKIKTEPLSPGDCVDNVAGIYFDNLPPIVTPVATVCKSESCKPRGNNNDAFSIDNNMSNAAANINAVSVTAQVEQVALQIFPNPVEEMISIEFNQDNKSHRGLTVSLLNSSGQIMKVLFDNSNYSGKFRNTYLLNELPEGMYIIKVESADGIQVEKFMKI